MASLKTAAQMDLAMLRWAERDPEEALKWVTGHFVALCIALGQSRGLDMIGDIHIDSGGKRDITIHAQAVAHLQQEGSPH